MNRLAVALITLSTASLFGGCSVLSDLVEQPPGSEASGTTEQLEDIEIESTELEADFPNPRRVAGLGGEATLSIDDVVGSGSNCLGYVVPRPLLEFEAGEGLPSIEVRGDDNAEVLAIVNADTNLAYCHHVTSMGQLPEIRAPWEAGTWYVFAGRLRKGPVETTIHFEDPSRALDLQWSEDIESMTFSEAPEELSEFTATTTGAAGVQAMAHGEDCSEQYFADEPVMRFDVERPITDMQLAIASPDDLGVMVRGPISEDNREMPNRCLNRGINNLQRLEPGRYAVFVGTPENEKVSPFSLLWSNSSEDQDPLFIADTISEDLTAEEKYIHYHMPYFEEGRPTRLEDHRLELFQVAPKHLFVFPDFDLDASSAEARSTTNEEPSFPRENEPLLWVDRNTFVAADGALFSIDLEYLNAEPTGAVSLPTEIRNNQQGERINETLWHEEDMAVDAEFRAFSDARDECIDRAWAPIAEEYSALVDTSPRTPQENERKGAIEDEYGAIQARQCPESELNEALEVMREELHENRATRRNHALEQNAERLQSLW